VSSAFRRVPFSLVVVLALTVIRAEAATSLTLAWDANPEPDVAGYVLHADTTKQYC
jgi:hypothetical protein